MAKFLFVIVCACYCTVCVHLMTTALAEASATAITKIKTSAFNQKDADDYVTPDDPRQNTAANKNDDDILSENELDADVSKKYIDTELRSFNYKPNDIKKQIGRRKATVNRDNLDTVAAIRAKRHSIDNDHEHEHDHNDHKNTENVQISSNSQIFIKKLFDEYGDAEKQTMTLEGFERMLEQLGMDHLLKTYQSQDSIPSLKPVDERTLPQNETCLSVHSLLTRMFPQKQNKYSSDTSQRPMKNIKNSLNKSNDQLSNENHTKSVASDQISIKNSSVARNVTANNSSDSIKENLFLDKFDLLSLCPILLYQLAAPTSPERSGCIKSDALPILAQNIHEFDHDADDDDHNHVKVWVYATISITVASLCGLFGVAVIPCMERRYYQQMLQFFVALGIGTLAGDALLHLLPHAMLTFHTTENVHASMTWKGLVATLGIIFFFLTERLLTMIAEWRKRIQKRDDPPARVRVMRDLDSVSLNHSLNGEKQCKHKYSSYPYCYDEIALDTKDDHHQHHQHGSDKIHGKENGIKGASTVPSPKDKLHTKSIPGEYDTAESLLSAPNHNYTISDGYFKSSDDIEKEEMQTLDNKTILTNLNDGSVESCGCGTKKTFTPENFTIILREHESKHHGHSHTHGHVHSPPKTLSAVAWMVVMGDGLHNFTDGMAIGAAFSNSIAGGFSTAIAVFCHELPHELGDFAVLLKAGMSARKAVYYNILSSVLSFLGMVLGIIVGDTPEASAWIFACAAGMFIYIALVDMMPELATAHKEHCALQQCLIQLIGMVLGVGIMLVIALFEDDLKIIFSPNAHAHSHGHHH